MARDALNFISNLLANSGATGSQFFIGAGKYMVLVVAGTGGANVQLQLLGPDGTTWLPVTGGLIAINGAYAIDLCEGWYRTQIAGGLVPAGIYMTLKAIS